MAMRVHGTSTDARARAVTLKGVRTMAGLYTYPTDDFEFHMAQAVYWQTLARQLRQAAKTRNPSAIEALIFDAEQNAKVHADLASQCRPDDLLTHQQRLLDVK